MKITKSNYYKHLIIYFFALIFLFYVLKTIGIREAKWQHLLLFIAYIPIVFLFKKVQIYPLFLFSWFVTYSVVISLLSYSVLSSITYFIVFSFIFLMLNLILSSRIIVSIFYLKLTSILLMSIPLFSVVNQLIGLNWYQPFSINISVLDFYWAATFPFLFLNLNRWYRVALLVFSVILAIMHDADAVVLIIPFVVIMSYLEKYQFVRYLVIHFSKNVFIYLFVVSVASMIFVELYFNLDIESLLNQKGTLKAEGVGYHKRLALIYEGFYFSMQNFIFGVGYGIDNYFNYAGGEVTNAPQFFPFTIIIYSGVVGFFIITLMLSTVYKQILRNSQYEYAMSLSLFGFFLMILIHEYLFNPLSMFSLITLAFFSHYPKK